MTAPEHRLSQFMLVPCTACQANCAYCFGPNNGAIMAPERMDAALDYVARIAADAGLSVVKVTFHGGEPLVAGHALLRQALEGLTRRFGRDGFSAAVQSNLWLLDDEFCRLFADYRVALSTSLDGPEELTDQQRGPGYFRRTIAGIRLARNYDIPVGCVATFTPLNAARWPEVLEFFKAERLGAAIHPAMPALPLCGHAPKQKSDYYIISPQHYGQLLGEMFAYYLEQRREIALSTFDHLGRGLVRGEGKLCIVKDCLGMFLVIDAEGDIYACQRFCGHPEYRLGTLDEGLSLPELLQRPVALRMQEREARIQALCGNCRHYAYCKGGCVYSAWASHTEDQKDPYCPAYKRILGDMAARLDVEMASEENIAAIAARPYQYDSHPLLKRGALIDIVKNGLHPIQVARAARRVIAAVELARGPDLPTVAARLVSQGIARSQASAEWSLTALQNDLQPQVERLNNLYLHLTLRCQLRCTHCYACADTGDIQLPDMPVDSIIQLLHETRQVGFRKVMLTGGEPLLHSEWRPLMTALRKERTRITPTRIVLRTNFALPLTDDDLWLLAEALDQIVVSVDGDEATHDARRGKGSYQAMRCNLEAYRHVNQNSAELCLSSVLRSIDILNEPGRAVHELGRRLAIKNIRFRPVLPLGRAKAWPEPPVSKRLTALFDPAELLEQGVQPVSNCGLGHNLYVDPSGEAFPCYACRHPENSLGNVFERGLTTLVQSDNFQMLAAHTVDTIPRCQTCEVRYLCGGMCRAWDNNDPEVTECHELQEQAYALLETARDYLRSS